MSRARLPLSCMVLALSCASCGYLSHEPRGSRDRGDTISGSAGQGVSSPGADLDDPQAGARADTAQPSSTQPSAGAAGSRSEGTTASQQSAPQAGTDAADGDASASASGPGAAPGPESSEPSIGSAAEAKPEVWVGELWSLGRMLCPLQPPFDIGSDVEDRTERVVLLIDADSDPRAPTGRIRFGRGELPTTPAPEPQSPATPSSWSLGDSLFTCSSELLAEGGEYSVLEAERSPSRLMFVVAPAEIWQPWCTSRHWLASACPEPAICDDPWIVCPCGASGCLPRVGARIRLDFRVDGDEMETVIDGPATYAELRLERAQ